jgi:integrase
LRDSSSPASAGAEAASLRWDDVDFGLGMVHLPAARAKTKKKLDLPMSDVVRDRLVARRAIGRDPFVFPSNSRSGYLSEPKVGLAAVLAATGIKMSVHELRRSFITVAQSTGMSP